MLREDNSIDLYDDVSNPLDGIEEILVGNDWTYQRMNEDELSVHISGKYGHYQMIFVWQDQYSAIQFCCMPDLSVPENKLDEAASIVNKINSNLWLGHFDIRAYDDLAGQSAYIPCFRHASLFRGLHETSGTDHMADLIDIALAECERYYVTFDLLSKTAMQDNKDVDLAMMDVIGRS